MSDQRNDSQRITEETGTLLAEEEKKSGKDSYIHKFQQPFNYEGRCFESLLFAWGDLTGEDSLAIERELQDLGRPVIIPTFSGEYLARMAARACRDKIGEDTIRAMPISDYHKIRSAARSFLLQSGL